MNWIEITPTYMDQGAFYGEHDGAPDTVHRFRWVYPDRTPATEWVACTDCVEWNHGVSA